MGRSARLAGALTLAVAFVCVIVFHAELARFATHTRRLFHKYPEILSFSTFCGTQIVTVAIFCATQIVTSNQRLRDSRELEGRRIQESEDRKRRAVIGIFKEMHDNVEYGLKLLPNAEATLRKIYHRIDADEKSSAATKKPRAYRPLIGITDSSHFYSASSDVLTDFHARCLVAIIAYYRSVDDQRLIAALVDSPPFLILEPQDRKETVKELVDTFVLSTRLGTVALTELEKHYPADWFAALKVPAPVI